MIVRLTHNQANAVFIRVPDDITAAMQEHRVVYGPTQHNYLLPAIGWRRALDAMLGSCLGPAGGMLKGKGRPSDSAYRAIRRIANPLKLIEAHPALREGAAAGWLPDVVPAFLIEDAAGLLYSPYPRDNSRFTLMVPQHLELSGQKMTVWSPAMTVERELLEPQSLAYQESFHLLLGRQVVAGAER